MARRHEKYRLTTALLKPINAATIVFLGFYTVLWGVWIGNPLWDAFDRAQLYTKMEALAPENIWGGIAVLAGIVMCYGAFRPSYTALILGSVTAFFHWLTISIFYFWGDWQNTGGIVGLLLATYAAFMYLNLRVNHKNGRMSIAEMLR